MLHSSIDECGVYENLLERTCKDDLNEREIELLKSLVNKNVVKRVTENKKTYYERKKGSYNDNTAAKGMEDQRKLNNAQENAEHIKQERAKGNVVVREDAQEMFNILRS